jgi:hypothetical protein
MKGVARTSAAAVLTERTVSMPPTRPNAGPEGLPFPIAYFADRCETRETLKSAEIRAKRLADAWKRSFATWPWSFSPTISGTGPLTEKPTFRSPISCEGNADR